MPLFKFGPSGGVGGNDFDDDKEAPALGFLNDCFVVEVRISHGKFIDAVQFVVQHKITGQIAPLPRHGGTGGEVTRIPVGRNKVIGLIRGLYGQFVDSMSIDVVDIGTGNVQTFGPFGGVGGDVGYIYDAPFSVPFNQTAPLDNSIIGFVGRSGKFVDAIGVIIKRPL